MSKKILESQKTAINKIAGKWIKNLEKDISSNIQKYCSSNKTQLFQSNSTHDIELNNYISELLKDKRKEFAKILVEKWAEEKKKELDDNPQAYIS